MAIPPAFYIITINRFHVCAEKSINLPDNPMSILPPVDIWNLLFPLFFGKVGFSNSNSTADIVHFGRHGERVWLCVGVTVNDIVKTVVFAAIYE